MSLAKRSLIGLLAALGLLAMPTTGAGPVAAGNPCYHGFDMPEITVSTALRVEADPCAFSPTLTVVPVGATVTFANGPEFAHLVTGANQAWGDREVELAPNATVAYTFVEPGIYPYACILHPGMSGTIVVGDGGPALAGAMTGAPAAAAPGAGEPAPATVVEPAPAASSNVPLVAALGLAALLAGGVLALAAASRRSRRPEAVNPEALPR